MNLRLILILTTAILIVGIVLAVRAGGSKFVSESTRTRLAMQRAELTVAAHHWETEETSAKKMLTEGVTKAEPITLPVRPETEAPPSTPAISYLEWMKDPKIQVLSLASARAELAISYGPFFRAQNLSPAQVEKLRDVLIKHKAFIDDIRAVSQEKELSSRDPAITAQRQEADAELRDGATDVLGPAGYERLKNYERALPVRTFVGKIAGAATLAGVPMSTQQVETLTTMIAQTNPRYAAGESVDFQRVDWKTAEAQARTILSPEQLKFFKLLRRAVKISSYGPNLIKASFRSLIKCSRNWRRLRNSRCCCRKFSAPAPMSRFLTPPTQERSVRPFCGARCALLLIPDSP